MKNGNSVEWRVKRKGVNDSKARTGQTERSVGRSVMWSLEEHLE